MDIHTAPRASKIGNRYSSSSAETFAARSSVSASTDDVRGVSASWEQPTSFDGIMNFRAGTISSTAESRIW